MAMKKNFDKLFYKIRKPVQEMGKLPPNWGQMHDDNDYFENPQNYKFVDHPADNQVDYNSIIDFLEEEHMRREVFTTVIDTQSFSVSRPGHISDNPSVSCDQSFHNATSPAALHP